MKNQHVFLKITLNRIVNFHFYFDKRWWFLRGNMVIIAKLSFYLEYIRYLLGLKKMVFFILSIIIKKIDSFKDIA